MWWCMPVLPVFWEAEAGGWLVQAQPAQLGDVARTCLKIKKKLKRTGSVAQWRGLGFSPQYCKPKDGLIDQSINQLINQIDGLMGVQVRKKVHSHISILKSLSVEPMPSRTQYASLGRSQRELGYLYLGHKENWQGFPFTKKQGRSLISLNHNWRLHGLSVYPGSYT